MPKRRGKEDVTSYASSQRAQARMESAIGAVAALFVLWVPVAFGMAASQSSPITPGPQLTPGATLEVTTSDLHVPG